MPNEVMKAIEGLLARNRQLQAFAEQEEWVTFGEQVEGYLMERQSLFACNSFVEDEISAMAVECLKTLLGEDARLVFFIKSRLAVLSQDMSTMRKSRRSVWAYNTF